jgi:hypothetical protein
MRWRRKPLQARVEADTTRNEISGGVFTGAVTLARDVTVHASGPAPQALAGLPAAPVGFVGRDDALGQILTFLDPFSQAARAVVVSAGCACMPTSTDRPKRPPTAAQAPWTGCWTSTYAPPKPPRAT